MFKQLLAFGLVLGSLLILVPQPTRGYSVKLLGDDTSFGEGPGKVLDDAPYKVPTGEDAFPALKGKGITKEDVVLTEIERVPTGEDAFPAPKGKDIPGEDVLLNKIDKIPMGDDAFPAPKGKDIPGEDVLLNEIGKISMGDDVFPAPKGTDAPPDPKGEDTESVLGSDLEKLHLNNQWTDLEIDNYLTKFGYLATPANGSVSEDIRKVAVKDFQRFSRLGESGVVDPVTMKQMKMPRCGMPDPVKNMKLAEFNVEGSRKWSKKHLTYKITKYSRKLPSYIVKQWVEKAFKMWADVSQLTFTERLYGTTDISVKFTPGNHGDGAPFDGKGGVLAHAFYPESGEVHLEEAEDWTIKSKKGTNLLYVLVHEIGHALGLGHSKEDQAIMEPVYVGYRADLALTRDDIAGIQYLYGKPTVAPPRPRPPTRAPVTRDPVTRAPVTRAPRPSPPTHKFPCPFRFDALMTDGWKTYGFFRRFIYRVHPDGRVTEKKTIASMFKGPYYVGAAAHNEETGKTFLFSRGKVWRYTYRRLDAGFPKYLSFYARAAVLVNNQLNVFSFTHFHILDQVTLTDLVDGEVAIDQEYPDLPMFMKAAISYTDGMAYILYSTKVLQLDVETGETSNEQKCSY